MKSVHMIHTPLGDSGFEKRDMNAIKTMTNAACEDTNGGGVARLEENSPATGKTVTHRQ